MAPTEDQKKRAESWREMLVHARSFARGWTPKGANFSDDYHEDGDEAPKKIRRNIGPVQFARKVGKAGAR